MHTKALLTKSKRFIRSLYGDSFLSKEEIYLLSGPYTQAGKKLLETLYPRKSFIIKDHPQAYRITFLEPYIYTYLTDCFYDRADEETARPLFAFLLQKEFELLTHESFTLKIPQEWEKAIAFVHMMETQYPDIKRSIYKTVSFVGNQR